MNLTPRDILEASYSLASASSCTEMSDGFAQLTQVAEKGAA